MIQKVVTIPTLTPHQMNGFIFPHADGKFLFAFRQTHGDWFKNSISVIFLNSNYEFIGEPTHVEMNGNVEDPRIFKCENKHYMTYVRFKFAPHRHFCYYMCEILINDSGVETLLNTETQLRNPDRFYQHEKNWSPFSYKDKLHFVYSLSPHIVYEWNQKTSNPSAIYQSFPQIPFWKWGELRGGTPSVRYSEDEYIAFFHSFIFFNNIWHREYKMGAYTFSAKPPFKFLRMTTSPIEHESFWQDKNLISDHRVVFPMSLLVEKEKLILSYGDQDTRSKIMEFDSKELLASMEYIDCYT